MKKIFNKNLQVYILVPILLLFAVSYGIFKVFFDVTEISYIQTDKIATKIIKDAIVKYIKDTGDENLENLKKPDSVGFAVISKLKSEFVINGKEYGPYLDSKIVFETPRNPKMRGWQITVHKSTRNVDVEPIDKLSEIKIID